MDCEKNKYLLPTVSKPLIYLRFLKSYNYTRTQNRSCRIPAWTVFLTLRDVGLNRTAHRSTQKMPKSGIF